MMECVCTPVCVCACVAHTHVSRHLCVQWGVVVGGGGRKWGWKKIRVGVRQKESVSDPEIIVCGPDRRTDRGAGPSLSLTADQDFQN